jgi:hypothetical protein
MFQLEHYGRIALITLSYCVDQALILLRVGAVPKYRHLQTDSFELTKRLSSGCGGVREEFERVSRYVLVT